MPVDILLIADECRELYDMQSEGEKATRQSFSPRRERSGRMWTPFSNISQGNISVCVGAASAKEKNRTFSDTQEGNGRIIGFYSPGPQARADKNGSPERKGAVPHRECTVSEHGELCGTGRIFPGGEAEKHVRAPILCKAGVKKLAGVLAGLGKKPGRHGLCAACLYPGRYQGRVCRRVDLAL